MYIVDMGDRLCGDNFGYAVVVVFLAAVPSSWNSFQ